MTDVFDQVRAIVLSAIMVFSVLAAGGFVIGSTSGGVAELDETDSDVTAAPAIAGEPSTHSFTYDLTPDSTGIDNVTEIWFVYQDAPDGPIDDENIQDGDITIEVDGEIKDESEYGIDQGATTADRLVIDVGMTIEENADPSDTTAVNDDGQIVLHVNDDDNERVHNPDDIGTYEVRGELHEAGTSNQVQTDQIFEVVELQDITADIDSDPDPTVTAGAEKTINLHAEDNNQEDLEGEEIEVETIDDGGDGVTVNGIDESSTSTPTDSNGETAFEDVTFEGDEDDTVDITFVGTSDDTVGTTMTVRLEDPVLELAASGPTTEVTAGDDADFDITVEDEFGDPVDGETVEVADDDGLDFTQESQDTDGNGEATFTASTSDTGEFTVTFHLADNTSETDTADVTVEEGDAANVDVTVISDEATADGDDHLEYEVLVEDSEGNELDGVQVEAFDDGTDLTYNENPQTTGTDGTVTFEITSTTAQEIEFMFEEQDNQNSQNETGEFVADDADEIHIVEAPTETVTAGDSFEVTINATDEFGNPAIGQTLENFFLNSTDHDGILNSTDNLELDGLAEATVEVPEDRAITPDDEYELRPDADDITTSFLDTIAVEAGDADSITITNQPEDSQSGEQVQGPPIVQATDEYDNPVGDVSIDVSIGEHAGGQRSLEGDDADGNETDADGVARFDDLVLEGNTGTYTLEFDIDGSDENVAEDNDTESEEFELSAGEADSVEVEIQPQETTVAGNTIEGADGASEPVANVTDSAGNPVEGVEVTATLNTSEFAEPDPTPTVETTEDGFANFTGLNITDAGDYIITFDAEGLTETADTDAFTIDPADADSVEVVTQPEDEVIAGQDIGGPPTVLAEDEFGNPVENEDVDVDFSADGPDGQVEVSGDDWEGLQTEPDGTATFSDLIIETLDRYTLTFEIDADGDDASDETDEFDVTESDADEIIIEHQPVDSVAGEQIPGDGEAHPVVRVIDEFGNNVTGVDVTVERIPGALLGDGFSSDSETEIETDGGLAEFDELAIERTDDFRLEFSVDEGDVDDVESSEFTVDPAGANTVEVETNPTDETTAGEEILGDEDDPNDHPAANVTDPFGNPVEDVEVTVSLEFHQQDIEHPSEDPVLDGETVRETDEDGIAEFPGLSVDVKGTYTLEFEIDDSDGNVDEDSANETEEFFIDNADPDALDIEHGPADTTAGQHIEAADDDGDWPTVNVTDSLGNPVDGLDVNVTVNASEFTNDDEDLTVETNDDGQAIFEELVMEERGTYEMRFEADDGALTNTSTPFEIEADAAIDLNLVTEPGDSIAGEPIVGPPTANVSDQFGNLVPDVDVTVDAGDDVFDTGTTTVSTDDGGSAQFTDLRFNTSGDYQLNFSMSDEDDNVDESQLVQSPGFSVGPASPHNVTILTEPVDTTAGDVVGGPPTINVTDRFGNLHFDRNVTVERLDGGSIGGNTTVATNETTGEAIFDAVVIEEAGNHSLLFNISDSPVNATSAFFDVDPAGVDTLTPNVVDRAHDRIVTGVDWTIQVTALDPFGNAVPGETISVTDIDPEEGASVTGLAENGQAGTDDAGVGTFPDVSFDGTEGDAVNIRFSSDGVHTTLPLTLEEPEAEFNVTIVDTNSPIVEGDDLDVTVLVENIGFEAGNQTVSTEFAGHTHSEEVDLDVDESLEYDVRFSTVEGDVGTHDLTVASDDHVDSAEVRVVIAGEPPVFLEGVVTDEQPSILQLTFDNPVRLNPDTPSGAGLEIIIGGQTAAVEGHSASLETLEIRLDREVRAGQTMIVSYDGQSDNIQSIDGIEAEPFEAVIENLVEGEEFVPGELNAYVDVDDIPIQVAEVGEEVEFRLEGLQVPGDLTASFEWEVNGETFETTEPRLDPQVFDQPGNVSANVTITTDDFVETVSFVLQVQDTQPPTVLLHEVDRIEVGEQIELTGEFEDNVAIDEIEWELPDGTTESGANLTSITHTFDEPGAFEVTATATDTSGNAASNSTTVIVEDVDDDDTGGISPGTTESAGISIVVIIVLIVLGTWYYYRRRDVLSGGRE